MEIKPVYVTFEQAGLLKEKGFNQACCQWYNDSESDILRIGSIHNYNHPKDACTMTAPEQWQVVEWFRLKFQLYIVVSVIPFEKGRFFEYSVSNNDECVHQDGIYDTPQEAYLVAFDYLLKNLI